MAIWDVIGQAIAPVTKLIDELHTSEEEKLEAKAKLVEASKEIEIGALDYAGKLAEHRTKVLLAEAQGSWLQSNWRPILMMVAIVIIANNYILVPYVGAFTDKVQILELPKGLWQLLSLGVTGYIVGRSGEKIVDSLRNGQ